VAPEIEQGPGMDWDIIIAGGGTAGSVLAAQLSATPSRRVLLIEAGPADGNPFIRLPKGVGKLMADPAYLFRYQITSGNGPPDRKPEVLVRGRVLGGSSAVNGMVYHRGQPQDYDAWEGLGLRGWGWKDIEPCFVALEDHVLPQTPWRGRGGPIGITLNRPKGLGQTVIRGAQDLGLPYKEEPNLLDQLGVGPVAQTIDRRGERVSAARGFLTPEVRRRPNLRIITDTLVERVLFEGRRAVGVRCSGEGAGDYRAASEVILSMGALETPKILQISGVGPAEHLRGLGVEVVLDSPGVGANYRDHYALLSQWRLRRWGDSENLEYSGWRLWRNMLRYGLLRDGPMATSAQQVVMFGEMAGQTGRADVEFLFAAYSLARKPGEGKGSGMERQPGCHFFCFPLRGTSQGSVMAVSADAAAPPKITPNYLSTDYDRSCVVGAARFVRRLMAKPELERYVAGELAPVADAQSDDELIDVALREGWSCYHSVGTCKMGSDGDRQAVLDERLRVRDLGALRVVDCSVMPEQVSANTNGPTMAIALRASKMIAEDLQGERA